MTLVKFVQLTQLELLPRLKKSHSAKKTRLTICKLITNGEMQQEFTSKHEEESIAQRFSVQISSSFLIKKRVVKEAVTGNGLTVSRKKTKETALVTPRSLAGTWSQQLRPKRLREGTILVIMSEAILSDFTTALCAKTIPFFNFLIYSHLLFL